MSDHKFFARTERTYVVHELVLNENPQKVLYDFNNRKVVGDSMPMIIPQRKRFAYSAQDKHEFLPDGGLMSKSEIMQAIRQMQGERGEMQPVLRRIDKPNVNIVRSPVVDENAEYFIGANGNAYPKSEYERGEAEIERRLHIKQENQEVYYRQIRLGNVPHVLFFLQKILEIIEFIEEGKENADTEPAALNRAS